MHQQHCLHLQLELSCDEFCSVPTPLFLPAGRVRRPAQHKQHTAHTMSPSGQAGAALLGGAGRGRARAAAHSSAPLPSYAIHTQLGFYASAVFALVIFLSDSAQVGCWALLSRPGRGVATSRRRTLILRDRRPPLPPARLAARASWSATTSRANGWCSTVRGVGVGGGNGTGAAVARCMMPFGGRACSISSLRPPQACSASSPTSTSAHSSGPASAPRTGTHLPPVVGQGRVPYSRCGIGARG